MTQTITAPAVDLDDLRRAIAMGRASGARRLRRRHFTLAIRFRAHKAASDDEWQQTLAALSCDIQGR